MNGKERMLAVLNGEKADRIPVFPLLMSFSAQRIGATYKQFATESSALAQSQINAYEKFGLDGITSCSDAFRITADLGADMVFPESKPPYAASPVVTCEDDLKALQRPDPSDSKTRMYNRAMGVAEMARTVGDKCLVAGWVDMPFAEACSVCGVANVMIMMYDEPELLHAILEFLTPIVIDFALFQVECGGIMVGCGDAAASLISPDAYREFALPYEKRVCDAIHEKNVKIKLHMCGNTSALINDMATCGADLYNVDHMVDFSKACECYGAHNKAFKGNLDPVGDLLQSTPEAVYVKAKERIEMAKGKKYILSAGCEVPAEIDDEVFKSFCSAVL